MPRAAREQSKTGIYHVMLRGVNRQDIFTDDGDYAKMIDLLRQFRENKAISLYAFCLMPNHVHLLLREKNEKIESIMRRLGTTYAGWFNRKHSRTGHLFQDRYKSEVVEDQAYFFTVLRYIHFNPVKANIVKAPSDYPYSSYNSYFGKDGLADTAKVLDIISAEALAEFHAVGCDDECLDESEDSRPDVSNENAVRIMKEITGGISATDFKSLPKNQKAVFIEEMKKAGLSIRQIVRLTGETYYSVRKSDVSGI